MQREVWSMACPGVYPVMPQTIPIVNQNGPDIQSCYMHLTILLYGIDVHLKGCRQGWASSFASAGG